MYDRRTWPTRAEARFAVIEFIESYYNRTKPHSSVGWGIPAQLMDEFFERTASAEDLLEDPPVVGGVSHELIVVHLVPFVA